MSENEDNDIDDSKCRYNRGTLPARIWRQSAYPDLTQHRRTELRNIARRVYSQLSDQNRILEQRDILRAKVEAYELALRAFAKEGIVKP
jgi:hypothetical protein